MESRRMSPQGVSTPSDPPGPATAPAPTGAEPETAVGKLEAHFRTLDDGALVKLARAVETARASDRRDATDEQILQCLRPRLRDLRPERVRTFQRSLCVCLEPFLHDGEMGAVKRKGWIPRAILAVWWKVLTASPHRQRLMAIEAEYAVAVREQRWAVLPGLVDAGIAAAADLTRMVLDEARASFGRRSELVGILGSDRAIAELSDIAAILTLHPQLTPALDWIRQAAPLVTDGRIADFAPPCVVAARNAYLSLHDAGDGVLEYFVTALLQMLRQPWQALRLVRMLSTDLSRAGEGNLSLIPARLFSDLNATLVEIGRTSGAEGGMSRRVWLMTCARLISDACCMIQGLGEEAKNETDPAFDRLLMEARQKVGQASESFASVAVRDCAAILPVRHVKEKDEIRYEPDMTVRPGEELVQTAQAAAMLFMACRKFADQEGLEKSFRAKEADLEHRFQIGIGFRFDVLKAKGRHPVVLAQLKALGLVMPALPRTQSMLDLKGKLENIVERYKT